MRSLSGDSSTHNGDNLHDVDTDSTAFKELAYLIWLARRQYLRVRGLGAQKDLVFRPCSVVQVSLVG